VDLVLLATCLWHLIKALVVVVAAAVVVIVL